MPELPEVETVRRGLAEVLEGRNLVRVAVRRRDLRRPVPRDFAERLTGKRVLRLDRRAKVLVVHLEGGLVWLGHLGMSGRMTVTQGPPPVTGPHDHISVETEEGMVVTYTDPRRFGFMDLTTEEDLSTHPALAKLGPEPLGEDFTAASLSASLKGRRGNIKAALLDQSLVAGLGNIYVCEALYRAGISPKRQAHTVAGKRAERLAPEIKAILGEAIAAGGSSLRDHVQTTGEMGYFQFAFAVYGREGKPCPDCDCEEGVSRLVQGGRSTFFCKKRQH